MCSNDATNNNIQSIMILNLEIQKTSNTYAEIDLFTNTVCNYISTRSLENFRMKLFRCEKIRAKNFRGWPNPTKNFNTKFSLV